MIRKGGRDVKSGKKTKQQETDKRGIKLKMGVAIRGEEEPQNRQCVMCVMKVLINKTRIGEEFKKLKPVMLVCG